MPVSSTIRIGADVIDVNAPCEVVAALKKMQLKLATGGVRQSVRIDDEEVTFQRANDATLTALIRRYETECARASGGNARPARYAKRFTFGS